MHPTTLADHFHFELPPEGFHPTKATDEGLRRYGLPHRPDSGMFPKAARLWLHSMRRIRRFIAPSPEIRREVGNVEDLAGTKQGAVTFLNYSTGEASAPIVVPIPTADFNGRTIDPPLPGEASKVPGLKLLYTGP